MVEVGAEHPEITLRTDYILSGILTRLGCLLAALKVPDPVADVTPLPLDYIGELYHCAVAKIKEVKNAGTPPNA